MVLDRLKSLVIKSTVVLLLLVVNVALGQESKFDLTVSAVIKDNESGKKLQGAIITLYKNGTKSGPPIVTHSDGQFEFVLKENNDYLIDISKPGMVGKKLAVSTKNIPTEELLPGYTFGGFEIYIYHEREGLDMSFYKNNPVAKAFYSKRLGGFDYDQTYAQKVNQETARIQQNLDNLRTQEAEEKAKQADYARRIAKADKYLKAENYKSAIKEYKGALNVLPQEVYPTTKLEEIAAINKGAEDVLAANATKQKAFDKLIAEGDAAFKAKKYEEAKGDFLNAINIKPEESYPINKLSEIEKLLSSQANELASNKKLQEDFDKLIASADQKLNKKDYVNAQKAYKDALALIPGEAYPKSKIDEITKILELAKSDLAKKKEKQAAYDALIAKADKLLSTKTYEEAKKNYKSALAIMQNEPYPTGKIAEIDKIISDNLAKNKADKATKTKFDALIAEGNKLFDSKNYPIAKSKFEEALVVIPGEEYPKHKINEIARLVADAAAQELAKKNKKAAYDKFVKLADASLGSKNYEEAISHYKEALSVSPSEAYPKTKIEEINKELAAKSAIASANKKKRDSYDKLISAADKYMAAKKYSDAEKGYQNALAILPNEVYPEQKLAEIKGIHNDEARIAAAKKKKAAYDKLIIEADARFRERDWEKATKAYKDALSLDEDKNYPTSKLADIKRAIDAENAASLANKKKLIKYNVLKEEADALFASKDYHGSILKFEAALDVLPDKAYPKTKIEEIEIKIAFADAAERSEKSKRDAYDKLIKKGDELFVKKIYADANKKYNDALSMYPNESYPKEKVKAIDKLVEDEALAKAEMQKKQVKHDKYVGDADKALAIKEYKDALSNYEAALTLFPDAIYPKAKIEEINKHLLATAAKKKAEGEKKASYDKLIASADASLSAKAYQKALKDYKSAKLLLPTEKYPATKISEIGRILADKALADAAKKSKKAEYNKFISSADALKDANNYAGAVRDYKKALAILPDEVYPKYKIEELTKILADAKAKDEDAAKKKTKYDGLVSRGNQFFNNRNYTLASKNYTDALILFPSEKYPREKLAAIDKMKKAKAAAAKAATAKAKEEVNAAVQAEALYVPKTAEERAQFIQMLAKKYPQGITEEILKYRNKKVIRRIVVEGDQGDEYKKVIMNYGGVFYFKNGVDISRYTFETESRPKE